MAHGPWNFVYPQIMQIVCWSFVAKCLTKFHLFTDILLEWKPCIYQSILYIPLSKCK